MQNRRFALVLLEDFGAARFRFGADFGAALADFSITSCPTTNKAIFENSNYNHILIINENYHYPKRHQQSNFRNN